MQSCPILAVIDGNVNISFEVYPAKVASKLLSETLVVEEVNVHGTSPTLGSACSLNADALSITTLTEYMLDAVRREGLAGCLWINHSSSQLVLLVMRSSSACCHLGGRRE